MLDNSADGEEDQQIHVVATFHDGKTVSVAKDKALWIPRDLYERTVFEIGLPKNVRQEFASRDLYPSHASVAYPTSGSPAFPVQVVPQGYAGAEGRRRSPVGWDMGGTCDGDGWPWKGRLQSASEIHRRRLRRLTEAGEREYDELIPGTDLTKSQLDRKVMTQIRLADRPTKTRTPWIDSGILKKSVSFADLEDAAEYGAGYLTDSGHGSQLDLSLSDFEDDDYRRRLYDEMLQQTGTTTHDVAAVTGARRSTRGRPRTASSPRRRSWRYWNNDPSPSVLEPKHYGSYREGRYRDCRDAGPVLLRDTKKTGSFDTGSLSVIQYNLKYLSFRFIGHFPSGLALAGSRMPPFWILLELRVMEAEETAGAI